MLVKNGDSGGLGTHDSAFLRSSQATVNTMCIFTLFSEMLSAVIPELGLVTGVLDSI